MSFRKMAAYAGIVSVLLNIASVIAYGSVPGPNDPAAEVVRYVSGSDGYLVAGVFGGLSAIAWLLFLAGFVVPFLKSDREHGEGYGVAVFGSGIIMGVALLVAIAAFAVIGVSIDEFDEATVLALWDFGNLTYGALVLVMILAAGAAAVGIMKRGVMARWFGILSAVVALSGITGIVPFLTGGNAAMVILVGFAGMIVWTVAASILMMREPAAR